MRSWSYAAAKSAITSSINDAQGGDSRNWPSTEYADELYNAFVPSRSVAGTMAKLLRDEVYLHQSKMMCKEPYGGGQRRVRRIERGAGYRTGIVE